MKGNDSNIASLKERTDGTNDLYITGFIPTELIFEKEEVRVKIEDVSQNPDVFFLHVIAEGPKLHAIRVLWPESVWMGDNDSSRKRVCGKDAAWPCEGETNHLEAWAEMVYQLPDRTKKNE